LVIWLLHQQVPISMVILLYGCFINRYQFQWLFGYMVASSTGTNFNVTMVIFIQIKSYHPILRRDSISRPIAPVSSVAGGDV
jgi:hypothetical protein